jgi:hypothetical protein
MFLPAMKESNLALEEKLKTEEGAEKALQIDAGILDENSCSDLDSDDNECGEVVSRTDELKSYDKSTNSNKRNASDCLLQFEDKPTTMKKVTESASKKQQVVLEFALGDFDGTPIAELEEEKKKKEDTDDDSDDNVLS